MKKEVTYKQAIEHVADLVSDCMKCMDTAEYLYPDNIEKQFRFYADSVEHNRKFYAVKVVSVLFDVDETTIEQDADALYHAREEMETAARAYVDQLDRL